GQRTDRAVAALVVQLPRGLDADAEEAALLARDLAGLDRDLERQEPPVAVDLHRHRGARPRADEAVQVAEVGHRLAGHGDDAVTGLDPGGLGRPALVYRRDHRRRLPGT